MYIQYNISQVPQTAVTALRQSHLGVHGNVMEKHGTNELTQRSHGAFVLDEITLG